MKKIILTEEQLKRVIDNVVNEQTTTVLPVNSASKEIGQNAWRLCDYTVIEENGNYFVTDERGNKVQIPFRDELQVTIYGRGRNAKIDFTDELTLNAINVGNIMKKTMACAREFPLQYEGRDGWICYMVRDGKRVEGKNLVSIPIYPEYAAYSIDDRKVVGSHTGGLGVEGYPEGANPAELVKQKDGAIVQYRKTRTEDFIFEVAPTVPGSYITNTTEVKPRPTPPPPPPPIKPPTVVQLDIQSPFEFDKVTLTPEAEQQFSQFIQKMKVNYQGATGDVEVLCSASIDADPAKKAQYNQKLSENRALTIVNRIKTETGITTMNFIPKGIGQTSQFAPNLKWPEVTDESKTAPNRRLIIKLPKITKQTN